MIADVVGVVSVPTLPIPRLIVITPFETGAVSAVAPVMGVAIEVVIVAAVVTGIIVTCTCTDCPHPTKGTGLGENEIVGVGAVIGRSSVPAVFVRIG